MHRTISDFKGPVDPEIFAEQILHARTRDDCLDSGDRFQELLLTVGIQFRENIIQKQHRAFPGGLLHQPDFGKLQGKRSSALLPLRPESAEIHAAQVPGNRGGRISRVCPLYKESDVISVRTDRSDLLPEITLPGPGQRTSEFLLSMNARTMREVADFVGEKLAPIDGVAATVTMFVLKKYKVNGVMLDMKAEVEDDRQLISA